MKVFCRNLKCKNIQLLDDPIRFSYRKFRVPLGDDDGYCMSKCKKDFPGFNDSIINTLSIKYSFAECDQGNSVNCDKDCIWSSDGNCIREEIFIDKIIINDEEHWVCKCHSDINFKGHVDFSRFGQKKDMY